MRRATKRERDKCLSGCFGAKGQAACTGCAHRSHSHSKCGLRCSVHCSVHFSFILSFRPHSSAHIALHVHPVHSLASVLQCKSQRRRSCATRFVRCFSLHWHWHRRHRACCIFFHWWEVVCATCSALTFPLGLSSFFFFFFRKNPNHI